jgi:glutathione peroxidase
MAEDILYHFEVKTIDGKMKKLSDYKDHVLLIVNTASKCGFTKQYAGLENLYQAYQKKGFYVLGFPCHQFGGQEPGEETEIQKFCQLNYNVTFPLFAKIKVNGKEAHPLFQYLKKVSQGIFGSEFIKWNFTKFLIDKKGNVLKRYAPQQTPESLQKDIEKLLEQN